jgi:asparagine synthase (glutamine-hydrolysing)
MCGFAGVVTWDEKYRVTQDTLEKMSRAIAHRGPDGEGYYLTRQNEPITPDTPQVGLAFRRLAILDPDPRSNQPFHIGPLTLVFNGEIYNFRELKSEISNLRPDYQWRTTGDTEVLLMAYEVWRERCVEKLNGMFAFAVWDEQKKELFLARDRMGQKPLYVYHGYPLSEGQSDRPWQIIAFASELGALRAVAGLDWELDRCSLMEYLQWGYVPPHETMYARVGKLPAGATTSSDEGLIPSIYFDPSESLKGNHAPGIGETSRLVAQAVRRQLVSDVPVGCFLSGGIDSSVVAAAMKASLEDGQQLLTFSMGFEDSRYDESQYAVAVAQRLGTTHQQFFVRPEAAADLPRLASVFGEPFGDSSALPVHYLARETRRHVKVALSGDGGDELFGGYERYRAMRFERALSQTPVTLRNWLAGPVAEAIPPSHPKTVSSKLKRLFESIDQPPNERYASYVAIFPDALLAELFNAAPKTRYTKFIAQTWEEQNEDHEGLDAVQTALAVDRLTYLPEDLLTKVDRCSMMHGLEVRSPFMDHELVQFAAGLTTDQLLKGGPKRMLREAFAKDLPEFVFKRKKMGFAVPIGEWFRGELRGMLRENLFASNSFGRSHFNMRVVERLVEEHETQRVDHSQRLYALLMLELWWQQQKG